MTPGPVQLHRVAGWRMPPHTRSVARPSRWGNPFRIQRADDRYDIIFRDRRYCTIDDIEEARLVAVNVFSIHLGPMGLIEPDDLDEWLAPLRGWNLACYCPLGQPCHRDVLLTLANNVA